MLRKMMTVVVVGVLLITATSVGDSCNREWSGECDGTSVGPINCTYDPCCPDPCLNCTCDPPVIGCNKGDCSC